MPSCCQFVKLMSFFPDRSGKTKAAGPMVPVVQLVDLPIGRQSAQLVQTRRGLIKDGAQPKAALASGPVAVARAALRIARDRAERFGLRSWVSVEFGQCRQRSFFGALRQSALIFPIPENEMLDVLKILHSPLVDAY